MLVIFFVQSCSKKWKGSKPPIKYAALSMNLPNQKAFGTSVEKGKLWWKLTSANVASYLPQATVIIWITHTGFLRWP